MPALLRVGRRTTPVLHEEQSEALLRPAEVLFRIHRTQDLVVGDLTVETVDQFPEGGLTTDRVVERLFAGVGLDAELCHDPIMPCHSATRSEERRVGKACSSRAAARQYRGRK